MHDERLDRLEEHWNKQHADLLERLHKSDEKFEQLKRESDEKWAEIKRESDEKWAELKRESDERFAQQERESDERHAQTMDALRHTNTKLDDLDRTQRVLAEAQSETTARLDRMDQRFDQLDAKLDRLDLRTHRIEKHLKLNGAAPRKRPGRRKSTRKRR